MRAFEENSAWNLASLDTAFDYLLEEDEGDLLESGNNESGNGESGKNESDNEGADENETAVRGNGK